MKLINIILIIALVFALTTSSYAASQPWEYFNIPENNPIQKRHFRAMWISTVINMDWPLNSENAETQKNELIVILDRAVSLNMNAVIFQVRSCSDAIYDSGMVPWSSYLTGTLGKDPGYDPLQFAISEAHKRNLELHAWFNPYRVSMNTKESTIDMLNSVEKSIYKTHPEWIKTANNRFAIDPGIPEARKWVEDCIMEVVLRYDIDAVHFDDYFYYESESSPLQDNDTFERYKGNFTGKGDWRRNNTYLLISELSEKIKQAKPYVKFGISPAGVWRNKKDDPKGSDTSAGLPNYDKAYADTKRWVEEGLIDYIAPQIYWSFGHESAPFGTVASWWADTVKGKNTQLYIGEAMYKVNDTSLSGSDASFASEGAEELARQLKFNIINASGSILFTSRDTSNPTRQDAVDRIKNDIWKTKALIPVMEWKKGNKPNKPIIDKITALKNGARIKWTDNDENTAYYAVYRFDANEPVNIENAYNLIDTVRKSGSANTYTDLNNTGYGVKYAVTAINRLHNESVPDIGEAYNILKNQNDELITLSNITKTTQIKLLYNNGGNISDPQIVAYYNASGQLISCKIYNSAKKANLILFDNITIPEGTVKIKAYIIADNSFIGYTNIP